ncbi:MAG TPA: SH3 domain-containing protein [Candidatus Saccharimonadales bacterium]|nr:SH3 domain-containing protein [Candidatus Saccharimonadales bacterium]
MKLIFKKIFICLLVSVFFITSPSFLSIVEAAASPWIQSNWSGGSGQTSWSDTTKFSSSSSSSVTSTPNQVTFTGSEKLTNTGLESDLTSWTQTAENDTTGVFSSTNFLADSSPLAAWPLGDTTSTQSYSQVFNPAVATGRNIVINGTFTSDPGPWIKGTGWTINTGTNTAHSDGTSASANLSQVLTPYVINGKTYTFTYTVSNYVSGTVNAFLNGSQIGFTARSSNGTFSQTVVVNQAFTTTGFVSTNFIGDVSNVTVTQVNIPASSSISPTQLLTDGDMEAVGTSAWTVVNSATLSKQTGTPHGGTQVLRVASTGTINSAARQSGILTVGQVYRIYGYVRSDGTATPRVSNSAVIFTGTTSTAWQPFDAVFVAGATSVDLGNGVANSGNYVEFDDVTVSLDNYIRPGEISVDGGFETWTNSTTPTNWIPTVVGSSTVNQETSIVHGGSNAVRLTGDSSNNFVSVAQTSVTTGKTYNITYWARADVSSGVSLAIEHVASANYQVQKLTDVYTQYSFTFVALDTTIGFKRNANTSHSIYVDDVSITEIDPLVGSIPITNLNGDPNIIRPTTSSASGGHLTNAYSFDGSNDVVNIYSSDLNSAFNPSEGTLVTWANYTGTINDGSTRYLVNIQADGNNFVYLEKGTTGAFHMGMELGGSLREVTPTLTTGWHQYVVTWSQSGASLKAYIDGAQSGGSQSLSGLTWTGNLASTLVAVGAGTSSGSFPWSGLANDVRLYGRALTSTEISNQYNGFTTTRDTATKFAGVASMKTVAEGHSKVDITQAVNVGDTESYYLSAYAYTDGSAVTSSDAELFYNGSTVSTTYTSAGGGWYQLTGIVTGANASRNYGVQTKSGKTVYLDNLGLKASSGTVNSSIFDTGPAGSLGTNYGNVNFIASTPINTVASVKVRTSNNSDMSGASDFSSCTALSTGASIQTSNCVVNGQRYVQYQLVLTNTDGSSTPTFTSITLDFSAINTSVSPPSPTCTDSAPSGTPVITSTLPLDPNTLKIIFTKVSPVSYYSLRYGDISGNYKYGVASFGDSNSTSYNVGLLTPNTTYYFQIRAGNGCTVGSWSSEVSGKTSSGSGTTQTTTPVVTAPVPSTTKIPNPTPTPTPTTGGTGPLPPEKPGGITLPTIDTKPISQFIQNNLNILSSWWNTVTSNIQQSFIAWGGGIESIKEQSFTLLASLFNGIEGGLNTVSGNIASGTSSLLKTFNLGTETYLTNVNNSLNTASFDMQNLSFNVTSNLIRSDIRSVSLMNRSVVTLSALSISTSNYITSLFNSGMNTLASLGRSISNLAISVGNTTKGIASSFGNQLASITNSTSKTTTQSIAAANKTISRWANAGSTRLASVFEGTDKAVTRVQTFLAITGEYWFNKEPAKIIAVKIENISPTSAVITWQTNQYSSSAVNYGLDTSYGNRAQSDTLVKDHKISIANLEPDKTYFFEVMSQGKSYVYDSYYTFQTSSGTNQLVKKAKVEIVGSQNDWILVRNAPTKEGGVIAKVQVGETFQLLMEKNGWYLIKLDGSEGWISKDFGKLIN